MPMCSFIVILITCLLLVHAALIVMGIYNYNYVVLCTCICMYIVANWHKHKSATPFWVAAGYVQAWRRPHDITSQQVFSSKRACMVVHSFTGYHYSLTIDSVCASLTEAQGLIACSIIARAYTTSNKALYISWSLAT